jgi:hypothetical protein
MNKSIKSNPIYVNQNTCEEVLGIPSLVYLKYLRDHKSFKRAVIGKLRMTKVSDWLDMIIEGKNETTTVENGENS